jgi:5'-nucleotidase
MLKPLILVTNDDGIRAPGLAMLAAAMEPLGEVHVFAPDRQQSAVGHGVSLHRPLRVTQTAERWHMVDGTPADCVMLAVRSLLPRRPALVVSGINPGANLGDDVTYSGTVAGAYEAMLLGLPGIAFSDVSYAPRIDTALSVNVPDVPYGELQGMQMTRMGRRNYQDEIIRREDPRGGVYYWIGGAEPDHFSEAGTDFQAIEAGCVSITPLHRDLTHHAALGYLESAPVPLT